MWFSGNSGYIEGKKTLRENKKLQHQEKIEKVAWEYFFFSLNIKLLYIFYYIFKNEIWYSNL